MPRIIKIELGIFLALLFGILIVMGLMVYGLSMYYAAGVARLLGFIPCKPPSLPQHIGFTPFAPQGNEVPLGGGSNSVDRVRNKWYLLRDQRVLFKALHVCV
ncbi:MAG: hypothetical protein RXR16_09010 [Thermocladium sp.]